ncbi:uncharacterized protein LOC123306795 [Coccinella septempunctata]|uniref:uncharacterized protein LOC123306795 n=1 Tax=Coccinella septempunctata TaxID=41139 RepID=UPI001D06F6DA|nr:uncharacterized protein LOC123306795 [Coccinella septempunctata]XP_044744879.1 uncharacterized protein LOC123306795 [Coccinella septempunctata]
MVSNCVVKGCSNEHNKNKPKSFHTFPFKRPDILKLWITAVGRENWYPSMTSKICEDHFLPSDYLILNMPGYKRKKLKLDAVPSVFNIPPRLGKCITHTNIEKPMEGNLNIHPDIHSLSTSTTPIGALLDSKNLNPDVSLLSTSTTPQIFVDSKDSVRNICVHLPYTCMTTPQSFVHSGDSNKKSDVNLPSTSTTPFVESKDLVMNKYVVLPYVYKTTPKPAIVSEDLDVKPDVNSLSTSTTTPKSFIDRAVQTSENHHIQLQRLKKKLKVLQQKVRRRDATVSKMKKIIKEIKKSGHNNKKVDEILKNYFDGVDYVQIEISE